MMTMRQLTRGLGACCVAMLLPLCLAESSLAAPGRPDPSFGHHGITKLDVDRTSDIVSADIAGNHDFGFAVVTRSADDRGVLVRFTPEGSVNPGFGEAGTVQLPGGPWNAVVMAANGAVMVAGSDGGDFALIRYTPGGRLDPEFGNGGEVTLHAQPQPPSSYFRDFDDPREVFTDLAIEPNGDITAVGNMRFYKREVAEEELPYVNAGTMAARFKPDGTLDTSFGEGGTLNPSSASGGRLTVVNQLTRQPDGKTILAGHLTDKLAVVRLTESGSLDPAFGNGGVAVSKVDTFDSGEGFGHPGDAKTVLVHPDGSLVVVGGKTLLGLRPDGSRDPRFGSHGRAFMEDLYGDGINASSGAFDGKGRILVAGDNAGSTVVGRFLPDGRRDRRFGNAGLVVTDIAHGSYEDHETDEAASAIVATAGGATFTAGFAFFGKDGELVVMGRAGGDGHLTYCHGKVATIVGSPGPDRIHGHGVIVAMGGDDEIRNFGGAICAGAGDDVIFNGGGSIYAGAGNDRVQEAGRGAVHGGPGDDVLEPHSDIVNLLYGDGGEDRLVGSGGRDRLFGGSGGDRLFGDGGADSIFGGPGDDVLIGGSGTDLLNGGSGSNQLRTGADDPEKEIYQGHSPGFHIRLRVEGQLIAGVHIKALRHCSNGQQGGIENDQNQAKIHLDSRGRFKVHFSRSTEYGTEDELFVGTVRPNVVRGFYREQEREQFTCTTGRPDHPTIHFIARRQATDN